MSTDIYDINSVTEFISIINNKIRYIIVYIYSKKCNSTLLCDYEVIKKYILDKKYILLKINSNLCNNLLKYLDISTCQYVFIYKNKELLSKIPLTYNNYVIDLIDYYISVHSLNMNKLK